VLAPLVALIRYMPLKRKILFHHLHLKFLKIPVKYHFHRDNSRGINLPVNYLSPVPQALPQAAGLSAILSPEPQALPQAAGLSAFLSPEPHALPQDAAIDVPLPFLQPAKLESAINIHHPFIYFSEFHL
jgi:hypothetical protein